MHFLVAAFFLFQTAKVPGVEPASPEPSLAYEASIRGAPSEAMLNTLRMVSDTLTLRRQIPASHAHLRRRIARDIEGFREVLHSEGYYGAEVRAELDEDVRPIRVRFVIEPGEPYLISSVTIEPLEALDPQAPDLPDPAALGLRVGEPLRARAVLDAESRLLDTVREWGYPFPNVPEREVIVDHAIQQAEVTFYLEPGPRRRFGPARITGLTDIDESFVHAMLEWTEGDWFKGSLLGETQHKLHRTRLFSVVRIEPIDEVSEFAPMAIELVERQHRTISAGLRYHTDTGVDFMTSWEHRNIQALGRRLSADLGFGQTEQGVGGSFRIPHYRRADQVLVFEGEARRRDLDAYLSRRVGGVTAIERIVSDRLSGRIGVAYRLDRVEQKGVTNTYHLVSLPVSIAWTTADDRLDPTEGTRVTLSAEPFMDVVDLDTSFFKTETSVSHYLSITESRDLILALRTRLGMIVGAGRGSIPPDERFYAGGGGSVRGYPYRTISPLIGDVPIGGRSLFETSVELRKKITETLGVVVFVDGGTAPEPIFPKIDSDYRVGAGVGARYYTPIGPLRLDVAVPLNRRSEVDSSFEIYVSLGQAF